MNIEGILIDLDGVLYVGDQAIPGADEALAQIRDAGIKMRFLTNTTTRTAASVIEKLERLGFEIASEEVFTAVTATRLFLQFQAKPATIHLLVRDSVRPEFEAFPQDQTPADFVIVGDIGAAWSYELMNDAFRHLLAGAELIAMHKNRFFQDETGLTLDIGAFVAGLEYASGHEARIIGKPSAQFFGLALDSLALPADKVAMLGDDIETDIGGGQAAGLTGILVKTGKYREEYVAESGIQPDSTIESIAELPTLLSQNG
tara:strand:+ start:25689 stop:26465 length:777 start_codon:yes stop_codon:yes gene_type:complete